MLMIIILLIVLIFLANIFNFCLTARQTENSKKLCFVVLMQYTSKFVFSWFGIEYLIIHGALNLFMVVKPSETQLLFFMKCHETRMKQSFKIRGGCLSGSHTNSLQVIYTAAESISRPVRNGYLSGGEIFRIELVEARACNSGT